MSGTEVSKWRVEDLMPINFSTEHLDRRAKWNYYMADWKENWPLYLVFAVALSFAGYVVWDAKEEEIEKHTACMWLKGGYYHENSGLCLTNDGKVFAPERVISGDIDQEYLR